MPILFETEILIALELENVWFWRSKFFHYYFERFWSRARLSLIDNLIHQTEKLKIARYTRS